jgi:hypothetical protein
MGELLAISLGWILITVLFLLPAMLGLALPRIGLPAQSGMLIQSQANRRVVPAPP